MLITQDEKQTFRHSNDPLVVIQFDEFAVLRRGMSGLDPESSQEHALKAKLLAMNLCDLSRQIVFRLHRVTENQLLGLIEEFRIAANVIRSWQLSHLAGQDRELVQKYAKHIDDRATLLNKQLNPGS